MVNRIVAQKWADSNHKIVDKATINPLLDCLWFARLKKGAGDVFPDYKTDDHGRVKILTHKISSQRSGTNGSVKVNLLKFAVTILRLFILVSQKIVVPKGQVVMNVSATIGLSLAMKRISVWRNQSTSCY